MRMTIRHRRRFLVLVLAVGACSLVLPQRNASAELTPRSGWEVGLSSAVGRYGIDRWETVGFGDSSFGWSALSIGWHKDPWRYSLPFLGLGFRLQFEFVSEQWALRERAGTVHLWEPSGSPAVPVVGMEVCPRLKLFDFAGQPLFGDGLTGLSLQFPVGVLLGFGGLGEYDEWQQELTLNDSVFWTGFSFGFQIAANFPIVRHRSNLEVFLGPRFSLLPPWLCGDSSCDTVETHMGPMLILGARYFFGTTLDEAHPVMNTVQ